MNSSDVGVVWLGVLLPLTRIVPFAYLAYQTRGRHTAYQYALLVLLCGTVASTVNGATVGANAFAYELHIYFLLLTPFSIITCDACWPPNNAIKPLIVLTFSAITVVFSSLFLDDVMIILLCYCLGPLGVYTFIAGERKWSEQGYNMLSLIASVVFGILSSLAFGGNDWQKSLAQVGVAISCTTALLVIPLSLPLQPIAFPPSSDVELSMSSSTSKHVIEPSCKTQEEDDEMELDSSA
jgi:hypothetical protein